jgi:hypothetical protein
MCVWFTAPALSRSLPTGFRPEQQSFSPLCGALVTPCAYFGREKRVCEKLQRHPLIDPIFSRQRLAGISVLFAQENLHLVTPPQAGLSRYISAIKLLAFSTMAAIVLSRQGLVKYKNVIENSPNSG